MTGTDGTEVAVAGAVASADGVAVHAPSDKYSIALAARRRSYGPNTSLSYEQPLMIIRGDGTYLFDEHGVSYLDCVNNVSHLGHSNTEVVAAISAQLRKLNTNSRYLHPDLPRYTEMLLATLNTTTTTTNNNNNSCNTTCSSNNSTYSNKKSSTNCTRHNSTPEGCSSNSDSNKGACGSSSCSSTKANTLQNLEVLYLVCSGSEANDLALRLISVARPGATHVAVMGGAYHGHTSALIQLSPYKFWGTGGGGRQPHVHVVPCPDPYRGENLDGRAAARAVLAAAERCGGRLGGFFCESILSCGGQVVLPPGYLKVISERPRVGRDLYDELRAARVVLVADEVQCGFGRCGEAFWGFQTQPGVAPDIVTMGKPIGNGYPLAALATTRELAAAFAAPGMEYFNTYGGSTAAVAAGLAVLCILQRDGLQQHAQRVGSYLLYGLRQLLQTHEVVGDVRGLGLFLGIEIVRDKASKRHAPATARWIKERMKARRVLISTDGPYDNVIKIKPPMVFGIREADMLLREFREVLEQELTADVRQKLRRREDELWTSVYGPRQAKYRENERQLFQGGLSPQARL
ncbi:hypothetical protein VOLCADRAFT_92827 [Volvox carteri f. nagariensis]|uniref:Uncharacterized protein n=1 Tax=Volvox carteri f. nagariensis TaxID=3068 RepID=D8U0K2_VOLCA|nr:uncharacterized protein VOLCADRAFT_92827 [Volvox carteri f. nagariensis]EFJ46733.1 hypothetical protein VOLCADRAFT_92827 [Volvox carteri f. nagariensis]|eukprot:XP_002952262.1 hypothetical protein VOLCADRAFT_92827 [Volvox carteri f. nagariensis]